ncbi:MAG: VOC family protein [Betaproteobacteria bacterium]|nr:VOC family protein [Betaproteobacteria bacterium]
MIRVLGIDHIVLRVRDPERMARFYTEVLGCRVERRRDDLGMLHLRAGSALIDLVDVAGELGKRGGAAPGKEGRNLEHFALRVASFDADAVARHLAAHAVAAGEVKTRYGAEGEGPSLYVTDPEGNVVELKGVS